MSDDGEPSNYPFDDSDIIVPAIIAQIIRNNNMLLQLDADSETNQSRRRGSIPGHRVIPQNHVEADRILNRDYLSERPLYPENKFHRQFRTSRRIFVRVSNAVNEQDDYFEQQCDGLGKPGPSTLQKTTVALRILAYGTTADATDEYIKMGESTAIECLKRFCRAIVSIFSDQYLRTPNANDLERILHVNKQRGFRGMLGSLDCMHLKWKNCPMTWAGQFAGRSGKPTIILEAVADYDLWIWHAYFGMPGSNNDINVLDSSPLFSDFATCISPPINYVIGGKEYNMGYYLTDVIYPKWATLVQSIQNPQDRKKKLFAKMQESCRKDVERAFGVLQSRFAIVAGLVRFWYKQNLHDIMKTCIILHNMIIDDERDLSAPIVEKPIQIDNSVKFVNDEQAYFNVFL